VGDQIARMEEALGLIRRLWDGEKITEEGRFYRLVDCKLHTLADRKPPIWVSAFGPQAAEVAGRHGDGLWTLPDPESTPEVIDAYREARRRAGHDGDGEQEMYEHGEREVGDEEFADNIVAGSDPQAIADELRELEQLGGTVITLQNNSAGNAARAI